ncbi:hypothetical protein RB195_023346 [Necator americanus]|uniref:Reverse transcriptase domain-containing protein n=1 Tax=Necator americanus TaxID=51031 RepID=A0ABR1EJQ4_NECAM
MEAGRSLWTTFTSTLKNNGSYERDVQQRCAKATSAFNSLTKCLWSTPITNEVKLRVYLSAIRPIMMYGSETWAAPPALMERLDCTERKPLRWLLGYFWPRVCHNDDLHAEIDVVYRRMTRGRCQHLAPPSKVAKVNRLRFFGHILRRSADRLVQRVLRSFPGSSWKKPSGRKRKFWTEGVKEDQRTFSVDRQFRRDVMFRRIWNSDEWTDSVLALAEDRKGWAELCSMTPHLSEDAGNRVKSSKERNPRTTINWDLFATLAGFWEDSAMDNIDEEYDRLVEHLHDCAKKAESFKTTKRRLSLETLELIRQRGAARAAGNQELTSELARLCREAIKEDLKERRAEVLAEAAEAGKSIRYARRDFASRKTRMTALRNPKGTAIASRRGMEKIIYDFYSDLFDSHVHLPPHHLREDGQVIPEALPSEIRHAIMSVRNRTAPGPDRIRPEHLKSLPPVLINTLARLFTRYLSECKVPKQWKTSKTVLLYKKGDPHDIGNYRPICLLSVIYKLFTRVILNRIEKVLDEGQPCEQAGFRKGFSTIDHIHTVSKLIEVSREYKMPLCLTFIDLKKAFDSVETEAVVEALDNQGVPTQYIKVLRELYSNFTTAISPFYKNIVIDVKRGVRQGDTISPKIFTATLENAMRKLEWDDMGVKVDGRQLHHLRFADDMVLVTPSISQAERMLTEFDETCGCIGLQLNLQKTMFMRNGWVSDAPFTLNGTNISECTSYVYLGRELNMMNDLTPELGRRRRAAWGAYKSIEDVVKKTRNTRLRAHLFNTTVLPALTYASETWAFRKQEENAVSVIERAVERVMLGVSRFTQVRDGIRSSLLRQRSKIRTAAAFAIESKIR